MLNNIVFFTWEETFLLDKELTRRKQNFTLKFGAEGIFSFDLENLDMGMVKQAIYSGGLFVTKKMIILHGIPYEGTSKPVMALADQIDLFVEDLIKKEGKLPDETILLFVSAKPDKRLRLYKFLERNATMKEFSRYKDAQLKDFIISQLPGIYIPSDVVEYLLGKVGADLYRLWFECEKLFIRCTEKKVTTVDIALVDSIVFGAIDTNAFTLLEKLFTDPVGAMRIVDQIRSDGEDWNKFAGMVYWSLKFSLFLLDLYGQGVYDSKDLAVQLWANPWQVGKSLKQIKDLQSSAPRMRAFYRGLVEIDRSIKTGKYPDTYFRLGVKRLIQG